MRFAVAPHAPGSAREPIVERIAATLATRGHAEVAPSSPDVSLVWNVTRLDAPRAHYLRPDASVFVVTLLETPSGEAWPDEEALRRATYGVLVKTMSNLVVHRVLGGALGGRAWLVTPELSVRSLPDDAQLAEAIVDAVEPLAGARVVTDNVLREDLPPDLWEGDEHARALMAYGRRLAGMNLLPSVFDLDAILDERDRRTVLKVFGIRQLSYGNLSVRRDRTSFWMSGRGVDKGRMERIGRDVFLVKGYDEARAAMILSVPPGTDPSVRVSVDAIEHHKIYAAVPGVGAIVHVHAWLAGVEATRQGWPCGTQELADEVLAIVLRQPDPTRAAAGLKNHGLTLTGRSLADVFERMEGRLTQSVPVLD
jgi:ribulose-5-phosphate 4-epimerase/fuculose-1-phosphate aldolase